MKAMILAAGLGTRMRPLTDTLPKPLLRAGRCSLIEHHIVNLARAGVQDIVINHFYLGDMIEEALGNGSAWGVNIMYSRETARLETAGGIAKALPLLGDAPFIVVSSDIWTDYDYADLQPIDGVTTLARLLMVNNPEHHPEGDFILDNNGRLHLKASAVPGRAVTYSGVSVMHPAFFAGVSAEPLPLRPLLDAGMRAGTIAGEYYHGHWMDIGTPERLEELDVLLGPL
ncbi:MAG: nucleotidyltransferase family protein [Gammaproteobacteria bacterium]|nr:nucleotidyltransferase family protein [Gammaproteobacteria bacterium]MDP2346423.1 nucleotidyltransferase family protein [Gammaproteobacteria bacterium]